MKYLGTLFGWYEAGPEGVYWAFAEDEKIGEDAMHLIDEGDHLTVWNEDGKVAFVGDIVQNYLTGAIPCPHDPGYTQPFALGFWVYWTQEGWPPDEWAALFLRQEFGKPRLRAELIKNDDD